MTFLEGWLGKTTFLEHDVWSSCTAARSAKTALVLTHSYGQEWVVGHYYGVAGRFLHVDHIFFSWTVNCRPCKNETIASHLHDQL